DADPGKQGKHSATPVVGSVFLSVPGKQLIQYDEPVSFAILPAGQSKHSSAPGLAAYFPMSQSWHSDCAETFVAVPGAHSLAPPLPSQKWPGRHAVCADMVRSGCSGSTGDEEE